MISPTTKIKWIYRTEFLVKHKECLTSWELDLLLSVKTCLFEQRELSFKQSSSLNETYHRIVWLLG